MQQMEDRWKVLYRTQDAVRWLLEIAQGLQYLHEREPMVRVEGRNQRGSVGLSLGRKFGALCRAALRHDLGIFLL